MFDLKQKLLAIVYVLASFHVTCVQNMPTDDNRTMNNLEYRKKIHNYTHNVLIGYSVFVIVVGSCLNVLNFACFYRMKKRNAQNIYLGALSIADLLNIFINILVPLSLSSGEIHVKKNLKNLTEYLFDKDLSYGSFVFLCTFYSYLVEVCLHLPVWIMVVLSFERFISIMWPFRQNLLSTRKQAKKMLIILISAILLWCTFKFETAGIEKYSTFNMKKTVYEGCQRNLTLPTIVNISTTLWAIVPEFLTLILNLLIIHRIKITTNQHRQFYPTERSKKITQATRVVLLLSIIFVLLISPTGILIILDFIIIRINQTNNESMFPLETEMKLMIARKFVLIFYETNLYISFPIYLITIKNFKENLFSFLPSFGYFKRKDSTKIGIKNFANQKRNNANRSKQQNESCSDSKCDFNNRNKNSRASKEGKKYLSGEHNKNELEFMVEKKNSNNSFGAKNDFTNRLSHPHNSSSDHNNNSNSNSNVISNNIIYKDELTDAGKNISKLTPNNSTNNNNINTNCNNLNKSVSYNNDNFKFTISFQNFSSTYSRYSKYSDLNKISTSGDDSYELMDKANCSDYFNTNSAMNKRESNFYLLKQNELNDIKKASKKKSSNLMAILTSGLNGKKSASRPCNMQPNEALVNHIVKLNGKNQIENKIEKKS